MLQALAAASNTVLVTALFEGQAALSSITDNAILGNPDEAANFATAASIFSLHIANHSMPALVSRFIRPSPLPFKEELFSLAGMLLVHAQVLKTDPVRAKAAGNSEAGLILLIDQLQHMLIKIEPVLYAKIAAAALQSGLKLFGHDEVQKPDEQEVV